MNHKFTVLATGAGTLFPRKPKAMDISKNEFIDQVKYIIGIEPGQFIKRVDILNKLVEIKRDSDQFKELEAIAKGNMEDSPPS